MSALDLTVMDPTLLTPAQRIMREMQLQATSQPPTNNTESDDDTFDTSDNLPSRTPHMSISNSQAERQAILATANSVKTELGLSQKYSGWLDKFVNSSCAEQVILSAAFNLYNAQLLERLAKAEKYTISDGLKKILQNYSMVFLMNGHLSSYRGPIADALIGALREIGYEEIPRSHDIAKLNVIRRLCNEFLTQDRYNLKKKLDASVKPNALFANIALLAHTLCKKFNIPITIELLSRLAVLRWSLKQHPDANDEDFWPNVDNDIAQWRGPGGLKNPDNVAIWQMFKYIYENDTKEYGTPGSTDIIIISSSSLGNDNQRDIIDKWAKQVQPPSNTDKGRKRLRIDEDEPEDEEEGSPEHVASDGGFSTGGNGGSSEFSTAGDSGSGGGSD
ncbi:uncharacterized protein C8R40DRAFT_1069372 [Lentinula edodes]|uniref:uncharacterized protein n=1 Tax=Lentinula edodes TaxID=5353 RepID=UPI001E8E3EF7|nr:uncharacterized protein C8R40DRAFT_1069372 [Lentinula edodes]KAH7875340.1 hypothetical protein C8R40DRAFT_1069372 [Lentinula edodes]